MVSSVSSVLMHTHTHHTFNEVHCLFRIGAFTPRGMHISALYRCMLNHTCSLHTHNQTDLAVPVNRIKSIKCEAARPLIFLFVPKLTHKNVFDGQGMRHMYLVHRPRWARRPIDFVRNSYTNLNNENSSGNYRICHINRFLCTWFGFRLRNSVFRVIGWIIIK